MSDSVNRKSLVASRALAQNSVWNLVGQGAPLLVAAYAIPKLISSLGTERFGVLTIGWMIIGYFGLFDFGLGRALTTYVAGLLGSEREDVVPAAIWTATVLTTGVGIVSATILLSISPWLVHSALKIPLALQSEVLRTFVVLALAIPTVVCTTGLRGALEAYQRFDLVNLVRFPTGVLTFAAPLLVLPFSRSLVLIVLALVIVRALGLITYLILCLKVIPSLRHGERWSSKLVRPLVKIGSWMTVSNIVSPLLSSADRFLIGVLFSLQAVTYYATPYEVITKLMILPAALSGVLFPAFSITLIHEKERTQVLFYRSVILLSVILFPVVMAIVTFSPEILRLWLGTAFVIHSTLVLQILTIGVFINAFAWLPFVLLQGGGRADLTAKAHLTELPIYLIVLTLLAKFYGINGVALAWSIRTALDAVILFRLSGRVLDGSMAAFRRMSQICIVTIICAFAARYINGAGPKVLFLVTISAGYLVVVYAHFAKERSSRIARVVPAIGEDLAGTD